MSADWTWPSGAFPNLTDGNCSKTSEQRRSYTCVAWAAGDASRWWWPVWLRGVCYWPNGVPCDATIEAFAAAYATLGYTPCADDTLQPELEKIALFAKDESMGLVTHAARQLESGEWTSKLGALEDIRHATVEAVSGPAYGRPMLYLARPRAPRDPIAGIASSA